MFQDDHQIIPSNPTHQDQQQVDHDDDHEIIREIHALTTTSPHPPPYRHRWDTTSHRSSSLSVTSTDSSENFTSMSREFNALVLAGTRITRSETSHELVTNGTMNNNNNNNNNNNVINTLARIREDVVTENIDPLAIVRDDNPIASPSTARQSSMSRVGGNPSDQVSVQTVKKEEVESKISAWQNAKIAKINNRFKREDAIINGWENEEVQKSSSWMKKIERKLEAKRAHAMEKMQNDIAKARRKAEERRATSEAKRGTKVARVMEVANLMRAVGRAPTKRSFF